MFVSRVDEGCGVREGGQARGVVDGLVLPIPIFLSPAVQRSRLVGRRENPLRRGLVDGPVELVNDSLQKI